MDKSEKKSFFLGYRKLAASDPCQGLPSSPLTTHPDLPLLTPPPCSRRKENSKERQLFMKKDLGAGKTQPGNKKRRGVAQKNRATLLAWLPHTRKSALPRKHLLEKPIPNVLRQQNFSLEL